MRLRCPHQGCPINVADDMVGARIRCPHCGELLFVDPQHQEGDGETAPPTPAVPPVDLENRLYEGLPPLSVMLAIRAGRAPQTRDDVALRAMMTADDWAALAAFEKVVDAGGPIQSSIWLSSLAALFTAAVWAIVDNAAISPSQALPSRGTNWLATFAILAVALVAIGIGRRRLQRVQLGLLTAITPWAAVGVALLFGGNAALNVMHAITAQPQSYATCFAWIATPCHVIAALGAILAAFWARHALRAVSPPQIQTRLAEALQHLP